MQDLQQLVKSLSKSEIKFIKHYYRFNEDKKRHQLFSWILEEKVKTDEEAANKLYGGKGAAYSHLKGRLKKDLLNLLLFEEGEKKSESQYFQNEINVLRLIIQGKLLLNRKVHNAGVKCLQEAIILAEQQELLNEKIIASDLLATRMGVKEGVASYLDVFEPIEMDLDQVKYIYLSKKLYYSIAIPNNFSKNLEAGYLKEAQSAMYELKAIFQTTKSPNVGYYYYSTTLIYYSIIKNYEMLYSFCKEFIILLQSSVVLKSKVRLSIAYLQIYSACIHLHLFEEALSNAIKAETYTVKQGVNELTVLEYQFLAAIRMDSQLKIEEILTMALKHPRLKYSTFNEGKWIFYQAVYNFKEGNFSNSLFELQKENELLKDKSGWLFGHKLLEIMCYMELEEFDMIEFRVESLRKLLQRQKDKNILRVKTIFNILSTFTKTGASYTKTYQKEKTNFELIEAGKEAFFWDPLGFEIIRFDTWFKTKLN